MQDLNTKELEKHAAAMERVADAMSKIADQVTRLGSEGLAFVQVDAIGSVMVCKAHFKNLTNDDMGDSEGSTDYAAPTLLGG